jgi:DNA polymerase III subunit epsilon
MRQIFLDTETTGLSPENGDRIIEVACVELVNRKLTGNNRHYYVNPGRDSHEEALKVHGITSEFLKDKPPFSAVADELMSYLEGADVYIHNAPFDLGFLDKELALLGRTGFRSVVASVVDTLALAKEMFPGKRNSLDALCDRLGVDNSGRTLHGALLDAELLADVYVYLTRGQDALLIESTTTEQQGPALVAEDLRAYDLPVLACNEQEMTAHLEVLRQIDKASAGKTVWKEVA